MRIGVLSLQGDFAEHVQAFEELGVEVSAVKRPEAVLACDALVLPGGESTTIGKLCVRFGVGEAILDLARRGAPIWGTCAGMILLAREIEESDQWRLGLMDITVRRNAFGRQVESFEADLEIAGVPEGPLRTVFIRAPVITRIGPQVEVLASVEDKIVAAREGQYLATAFHPELTTDRRVEQFFLRMLEQSNG
ncbi:MAG: pyridoxal 5'-phosphate synthase glutaminase subunit PdxT [candidate division WS1 bacterium]|nr:pyridoxal 5'-phosphate synthase glutaminase subunit PdxT [candidate division WS1 bacterium]